MNKYTPILELGRGGMATVYLAVSRGPGGFSKLQVVKQLREELAADPEFLQMFLDEAKLSARINHPNVVQTNEVGFDGKRHFIAMEFLDGQPLENIFRVNERVPEAFPTAMLVRILSDALAGLHYAHDLQGFDGKPLNVVHRDISPHNIFVTYDGQVKVVDFGIAKAADSSNETRTGVLKGKVAYMAPEQVRGDSLDRRADLFAIGAILWRALAGRRLWKGLNEMEIFMHLTNGEVPAPVSQREEIQPRLFDICMRALAVNPDDRYPTALVLQEELEGFLQDAGERITTRDIGKRVAESFAERRAEVKAAIEERLSVAESEGENATYAELFPEPQVAPLRDEARAPIGKWIAAGSVGAVAAIAMIVVANRGRNDAKAQPPTVAVNVAPDTQPSVRLPPAAYATDVKVTVSPPEAEVLIDEIKMADKGAKFPRDGLIHKIRAQAPGFESRTEAVKFDQPSVEVSIELKKATVAAWKPTRPGEQPKRVGGDDVPPPVATPVQAAVTPAPAATPKKLSLDTADPFAPKR